MNFVLWLVKRACKWVIDRWAGIWGTGLICAPIVEYLANVYSSGFTLGTDKFDSITWWFPITIALWLPLIGMIGLLIVDIIFEYFTKLHTQYRTEQPQRDKPKRKRKNDLDEQIEAMTDHYLSIVNAGLDLYEFKPERPTGDMIDNRYAQDAYTKQLVAFARAVGINSENKDYFEDVSYCDGCAKETNGLTAVPIAGIGISHQCPKCTPIIEKYERRYQEGETND